MKRLSLVGSLAVAAVFALTIGPAPLQAQCSGCVNMPDPGGQSHEECGLMVPFPNCAGSTGGDCNECPWGYANVPTNLTPYGTLFGPQTLAIELGLQNGDTLTGMAVLRAACSGAIVDRFYDEETALKARRATSTLVFE